MIDRMRLTLICERNGEIIPEIQNTTIGNSLFLKVLKALQSQSAFGRDDVNSFIVSIDAKWSGLHRQPALCVLLFKKKCF